MVGRNNSGKTSRTEIIRRFFRLIRQRNGGKASTGFTKRR
ncbi:hypothetical protein SGP15_05815 [Brenneria sp. L4-2C]|nr:hypothetical protein [Brenneria sp. L4-2C]MDX5694640.1 hypothetical protein [Brenneria sp. L4-2C]